MSPEPESQTPKKYTKSQLIYSGPYSDVFKGTDPQGNPVGIKVVDLDFQQKPHDFRQEIRILKKLNHKGICAYIDSFVQGEDFHLVMPFYETNLCGVMDRFLKKKTKFDLSDPSKISTLVTNELLPDIAGRIVFQLADALRYVHSSGILHRDIKPSNVFFPRADDLENPVLGDFGISYDFSTPRVSEPADEKVTDVASGYYKAPELCFGVCDYGVEIDYWSFGILISFLYSTNCQPVNSVKKMENEQMPELNDFALIEGIFNAFGVPTNVDREDPTFWEKIFRPEYHFVKFGYKAKVRGSIDFLIPRCEDDSIKEIFSMLTRYEGRCLPT